MAQKQREVTLRFVAEPTDLNVYGKVHGGMVMRWIDQTGHVCAVGWSGHPCVTLYVGGIRFYKPILVGSLVEVKATLIHTGSTSMHISVDVRSGDLKTREMIQTTHCVIVFVALDDNGNTVKVPAWIPETEEDKKLDQYALQFMEISKGALQFMEVTKRIEQQTKKSKGGEI